MREKGFVNIYSLVVLIVVVLVGFYLGQKYSSKQPSSIPSTTVNSTSEPSAYVVPTPSTPSNNEVSFTKINDQIYLDYNGKFYQQGVATGQGFDQPQIVTLPNSGQYKWTEIASSPEKPDDFSEVFSFKVFPDKASFILVMRWTFSAISSDDFQVFYYNDSKPGNQKLSAPIDLKSTATGDRNIPKFEQLSPDLKFASFNMYSCWNCDGGTPEKSLLNLETKQAKRIGQLSYFKWGNNGSYEYKDYIVIDCTEPTPGQCSKDPKDLPLKIGQF